MKNYPESYIEYLKSSHWKSLKSERIKIAKHRCEFCGCKLPLDGHHVRYRTPLNSCTANDIVAICRSCHKLVHLSLKAQGRKIPQGHVPVPKGMDFLIEQGFDLKIPAKNLLYMRYAIKKLQREFELMFPSTRNKFFLSFKVCSGNLFLSLKKPKRSRPAPQSQTD